MLMAAQVKKIQQTAPNVHRQVSLTMSVGTSGHGNGKAKTKRDWKALKTLGVMVGLFVCCWLPFFLVYLAEPFCRQAASPDGYGSSDKFAMVLLQSRCVLASCSYIAIVFLTTRNVIVHSYRPVCQPMAFVFHPTAVSMITWLGYTNSIINPFIYALLQLEFRAAYRHILHCNTGNR